MDDRLHSQTPIKSPDETVKQGGDRFQFTGSRRYSPGKLGDLGCEESSRPSTAKHFRSP
jgi:hypothetical protein